MNANIDKFGKIGVLAGGPSSEREISLKSGTAVYSALKEMNLHVEFFDIKKKSCCVLKKLNIDAAFIALHGGFGEDGTIQKMLEDLNIPYTGSGPEASRLALDKVASRSIFINNKIPVPESMALNKRISIDELYERFNLPMVVKPSTEGSSVGLTIVKNKDEINKALNLAFKYSKTILVEKYIKGREITVGILHEEALPVIEIITKHNVYDYSAKYIDKETQYIVPAEIPKKTFLTAQELGLRAHNVLGCMDFSRVDMRMDENENVIVLEVNTIPGLTERSLLPKAAKAIGINFGELCVKLLELALLKKR